MATKIAFTFPGQGSQSPDMLVGYSSLPEVEAALSEASEVLDVGLADAVRNNQGLDDTTVVQPLMVASGVGIYRAWRANGGPEPSVLAGHSVGEYAALIAGGALTLSQGIDLVAKRAAAMHAAVEPGEGAMAAVLGLAAADIEICCEQQPQAWIANLNSDTQTVIAGKTDAVAAVAECCRAAGAKRVVKLNVAIPSHCPLMQTAAQVFAESLAAAPLQELDIPIIHNANNSSDPEPEMIRSALLNQLCAQVNWLAAVKILDGQADMIVECGHGRVLHNLNRRIAKDTRCEALDSAAALVELSKQCQ